MGKIVHRTGALEVLELVRLVDNEVVAMGGFKFQANVAGLGGQLVDLLLLPLHQQTNLLDIWCSFSLRLSQLVELIAQFF